MSLTRYRKKRNFATTAEPRGRHGKIAGFSFVVQKHAARRLHYDFRLELGGVLLSWAVPKGPCLDPAVKRLAVRVEDHPLEYGAFEGTIPRGEYGGGTVMLWDRGTWEPLGDPDQDLRRGRLHFELHGQKLSGAWHLVRTRAKEDEKQPTWLLIKSKDSAARKNGDLPDDDVSAKTGRGMAEIAEGTETWTSKRASRRTKPRPSEVLPMLATLVKAAPAGDEWLHELKLDGYRILARVGDPVQLITRGGKDWTRRMPSIKEALSQLDSSGTILDGEVVALRDDGVSDFQLLQRSLDDKSEDRLRFFAFDLLFQEGEDLRNLPLEARKQRLSRLLAPLEKAGIVRPNEHVLGAGEALYAEACRLGAEGIVSKKRDAPYRAGRSRDWLKVKCRAREEVVIGGYTRASGSQRNVRALLVGFRRGHELVYAGKVGTGFDNKTLDQLRKRLESLVRSESPFADAPRGARARGVTWVDPELVAEIELTELTRDGIVRQASFLGLRDDKPAKTVVDERSARELPIKLTHPDRVFYPEEKITKLDLARYYERVAELMLPHVANRPLSLVRCPEGRAKNCFFQKHATKGMPEDVYVIELPEKKGSDTYTYLKDVAGLVSMAQMGVLEIHTWGSRVKDPEHPDLLVMDLDPDEKLPFSRVVAAAHDVRALLDDLGLESFVKTTGGKGLHVCVPVRPRLDFSEAKTLCKALADLLVMRDPKTYVSTISKARRKGKIFVDYLRNGRGSTFIAPYSTRRRPGATVATPLEWDELTSKLDPSEFTVATVPLRVERLKRDPWQGLIDSKQTIQRGVIDALRRRS